MPLARIDLKKGDSYRQEIGRVVHEAIVAVGVRKDNRFQIISEHEPANFVFDPNYLDIRRSEDGFGIGKPSSRIPLR